jgi:hypothetical protein
MMLADPRIARLITLIRACLHPPQGAGRIVLALTLGFICHTVFAAGVLAMIVAMFFGLSESLGTVPWPYWQTLTTAKRFATMRLTPSLPHQQIRLPSREISVR